MVFDKFVITCPECGEKFNLTINKDYNLFNELEVISHNNNTELRCPNCEYYENDN